MLSLLRRKESPRFSVIIATYNRSRLIVPTIESALGQRHAPFEIIVVGDGCTDDTERVLKQNFGRRVRLMNLPEHSCSQSAPNNAGIAAARGTHIAYLGHDDIWSPHHLELLAEVFGDKQPDFAISGCIYYGPPGSMYYQFTGLFDDQAAAAHEFFPPSSLAHRRDVSDRIGRWCDPRECKPPVDCEFLLRAVGHGCTFQSTHAITVHKFAAGHRYLSYRFPSCDEQRRMLAELHSPAGDSKVMTKIATDLAQGASTTSIPYFDFEPFPPGELFQRNLATKGLRISPLERIETPRSFPVTDSPAGLDWFPMETHPKHGVFRWSGPNPSPLYFLSILSAGGVRLRLRVLAFANDSPGDLLQLRLNDVKVNLQKELRPGGIFEYCATFPQPIEAGLKLQFHLPGNAWLRNYSPARFAGLALSGIEIEPLS